MNKFFRVFCAVELPAEVRERAAAHIAQLREKFPYLRVNWERAEKMHLTLKFVGEIEMHRLDALKRAAQRASSDTEPFVLSIEGTGAFPPHGLARILWLGVKDESGALTRLQNRLETECALETFARENRLFQPHLTIARIRVAGEARELAKFHCAMHFASETFNVRELSIIRSELLPTGSRHTRISSQPLRVR